MKKSLSLLVLAALLALTACKKKPSTTPEIPKVETKTYDTVWTAKLGYGISPILVANNEVIYSSVTANPAKGEVLYKLNGLTGQQRFEWSDYYNFPQSLGSESYFYAQQAFVCCYGEQQYCLNTQNGQTLWRSFLPNAFARSVISADHDGNFYQAVYPNFEAEANIYQTNLLNGNRTLLLTFIDNNPLYSDVQVSYMRATRNSQNEVILFMEVIYKTQAGGTQNKTVWVGYNVNNSTLLYEKTINTSQNGSVQAVAGLSEAGFLYLSLNQDGAFSLACLNPSTGNIVWQKFIGDDEPLQQIYAHNNKIIAVPIGIGNIKSFDAQTGAAGWQFSLAELGNNSFVFWQGNSIAYKQYLFSVYKDQLLVINLRTGKPVYFKSIGFSDSSFRGQIAINEAQRTFYVQDRFSLVCFKLPKEVVF